ncbi:MAG: SusD/RagB family nutrient-binding outer membrane lipoprotein [Kordia sp.]|nr:MAG: SusD/RagB family nutrient-binding outer membrane lipoprotein [Kordia sp.]
MKKIKIILLLITTAFFASCDKDFEEVNKNPNDPTAVPSELLLGQIARNTANTLYSAQLGGDMGSCWSQQWGKVQYNDEARYFPRDGNIDGLWSNFYIGIAEDADKMYQLAIEEGNDASAGVALVMKANAFLWLTDLYGAVPFTDALKGSEGIFTPAYDSQATVYAGCYAFLDEAMAKLATGNGELSSVHDIIYGGNTALWAKFAASLKFRAMMRNSKNGVDSVVMQGLVDGGLLFSSTNDEAKVIYEAAAPNANPTYETIDLGSRTEYRIGEVMVQHLDGTTGLAADARLEVYAEPNQDGNYVGKPAGYTNLPNATYNVNTISGIGAKYLAATAPGYLLGYTELQFLLAEAAKKGYIGGSDGDAETFYLAGIMSSFAENGVATGGYETDASVAYNSSTALEQIATQKWIATYGQGFESWTEWRRTGYPNLMPAVEGNVSEVPSRITYPSLEQSLNGTNYSAQSALMSGGDALTTAVDWM